MEQSKDTNPKDIVGSNKMPVHLWPSIASYYGCLGMLEGLSKYGRSNFLEKGVKASIYIDAAKRHLDAWFEGEENATDSGVPHLGNALASIAIILAARMVGKLIDDRMYQGLGEKKTAQAFREEVDKLTAHVPRIKELYKKHSPHHYHASSGPEPLQWVEPTLLKNPVFRLSETVFHAEAMTDTVVWKTWWGEVAVPVEEHRAWEARGIIPATLKAFNYKVEP